MCRLFGLTASPRRVHASFWLIEAASLRNPDGVGLGYFAPLVGPVIDKEPLPAHRNPASVREPSHVASVTFVAHMRRATTGPRTSENTHPFAMDGMLFAHSGMFQELGALESKLGPDMRFVGGDTDSERFFALIAKEIRAHCSIGLGVSSAVGWIADNLPVYSLNFVLATPDELWAFRFPETNKLFVLDRGPARRPLHYVSETMRVHVPDLDHHSAVIVASEPLDDSLGWRGLEPGELLRVRTDLSLQSSIVVDRPPARPIHPHGRTSEQAFGRLARS